MGARSAGGRASGRRRCMQLGSGRSGRAGVRSRRRQGRAGRPAGRSYAHLGVPAGPVLVLVHLSWLSTWFFDSVFFLSY